MEMVMQGFLPESKNFHKAMVAWVLVMTLAMLPLVGCTVAQTLQKYAPVGLAAFSAIENTLVAAGQCSVTCQASAAKIKLLFTDAEAGIGECVNQTAATCLGALAASIPQWVADSGFGNILYVQLGVDAINIALAIIQANSPTPASAQTPNEIYVYAQARANAKAKLKLTPAPFKTPKQFAQYFNSQMVKAGNGPGTANPIQIPVPA